MDQETIQPPTEESVEAAGDLVRPFVDGDDSDEALLAWWLASGPYCD